MRLNDVVTVTGPLELIVVEDHDLVREELVDFLMRPGVSVRAMLIKVHRCRFSNVIRR